MANKDKIICIFGGTGFLGRHITQKLARAGYRIKISTRIPESAYYLKPYGDIGQVVPVQCSYNDPNSIKSTIEGADIVINLVGILFEKGKSKFRNVHVDISSEISKVCAELNVEKLIHFSALGIEQSVSKYARTKSDGEKSVQENFPQVTILRPSVVFGPDDNFFNMFAKLSSISPVLPLIGGGKTKFQPVYVGDIADAVLNIVTTNDEKFAGNAYELGGPEIVDFKEIYQILLTHVNRDTALVSVPWFAAKIQGFFLGLLPKPLLTVDQVRSLKTDNIVSREAKTLHDLGVVQTAMRTILPKYLACYRQGGRFADKKTS